MLIEKKANAKGKYVQSTNTINENNKTITLNTSARIQLKNHVLKCPEFFQPLKKLLSEYENNTVNPINKNPKITEA